MSDPVTVAGQLAQSLGRPPTLDELARALSWRRDVGRRRLRALIRDGTLCGSDQGIGLCAPADLDPTDRKLIAYVRRYRAEHDAGPTWSEVGNALGLSHPPYAEVIAAQRRDHPERSPKRQRYKVRFKWRTGGEAARRIKRLASAGWLTMTEETRSLDLGPKAREQ